MLGWVRHLRIWPHLSQEGYAPRKEVWLLRRCTGRLLRCSEGPPSVQPVIWKQARVWSLKWKRSSQRFNIFTLWQATAPSWMFSFAGQLSASISLSCLSFPSAVLQASHRGRQQVAQDKQQDQDNVYPIVREQLLSPVYVSLPSCPFLTW